MAICMYCGANVNDGYVFCTECGRRINFDKDAIMTKDAVEDKMAELKALAKNDEVNATTKKVKTDAVRYDSDDMDIADIVLNHKEKKVYSKKTQKADIIDAYGKKISSFQLLGINSRLIPTKTCSYCGTVNQVNFTYCSGCGKSLARASYVKASTKNYIK